MYLIIADYYSKFPVVRKPHDITSITVIKHMKSIFEEYGILEKLVTGHDTQFTSSTFGDFSRTYGFEHTTTSPYYPQANRFIERNVQTVKNLLQKCKESGSDPHLAMLCLRTAPVDHHLPSPVELLNNRMYQSNLPGVSRPVILLNQQTDQEASSKLQHRQNLQKFYHDHSAKELPPLPTGSSVSVFNPLNKKWEPGTVQSQGPVPKSYKVEMSSGSRFTRNHRHLRSSQVPIERSLTVPNIEADSDVPPSTTTTSDSPEKAFTEPPTAATPSLCDIPVVSSSLRTG